MSWKKTWFNYVIWILFIASSLYLLSLGFKALLDAFSFGGNPYIYLGGVCLCLALGAGLFFVARLLAGIFDRKPAPMWLSKGLAWLVLVAASTAGMYLRVLSIVISISTDTLLNDYVITDAFVGGKGFYFTGDFTDFAFSGILYGIYSFLGNQPIIAVWVMLIFEIIGITFVVLGIRKLVGNFGALVSLILYCCLFFRFAMNSVFDTFWLFYAAFGLCFFLLAVFNTKEVDSSITEKNVIAALLLGLFSGFLTYVNFYGVILLGVILIFPFIKTGEGKKKSAVWISFGWQIGSFILAYGLLTYFLGLQRGLHEFRGFGEIRIFGIDTTILMALLLVGLYSFFAREKEDVIMAGQVIGLISFALIFFDFYAFESNMVLYEALIMAAGLIVGPAYLPAVKETLEDKTDREETDKMDMPTDEEADPDIEITTVKLIENPIAMPKKHVAKVIDYDHEFEDEQLLDYDIKVEDNDDYDFNF